MPASHYPSETETIFKLRASYDVNKYEMASKLNLKENIIYINFIISIENKPCITDLQYIHIILYYFITYIEEIITVYLQINLVSQTIIISFCKLTSTPNGGQHFAIFRSSNSFDVTK